MTVEIISRGATDQSNSRGLCSESHSNSPKRINHLPKQADITTIITFC